MLFLTTLPVGFSDSNGGTACATCDVVFGLVEQTSTIHNESLVKAMERLCNLLPGSFQKPCKTFLDLFGPIIIDIIDDKEPPDVICHKLGFCYEEKGRQCNLFPLKKEQKLIHFSHDPILAMKMKKFNWPNIGVKICDFPGIKEICDWIDLIFDSHDPAVDLDGDRHSTYETLRGFAWRGKDCNDENGAIHPGARPLNEDKMTDTNCNGIKGTDNVGKSYETMLCGGSDQRGIAVLGDSISAHFHLPREWFNSTELSVANFEPLLYIGENELDWPAFSFGTGFMNATDTLARVIHGRTDSLYQRLWQRNHCNFRDYQNIAVNGARAASMVDPIEKSLFRNKTGDYPLIVIYALVGNDVCNGHPDTINHMTTPAEMRNYAKQTLEYLDANVPAGSFVFFTGLADGRVLYNSLHNRIHPIGSLRNDVTYAHFYDFFNCLEISPCTGWMNTNETLRNLTTERANQLSAVLQDIAAKDGGSYKNFKLYYNENPINKVINEWNKLGKPTWELLEPVDGFHANQMAQPLITESVWQDFLKLYPEAIGKENPNNQRIEQLFGDQGGYR